jgi:hypothetical protein
MGRQLGQPRDDTPPDRDHGKQRQWRPQVSGVQPPLERPHHHFGDEHGLGDDQRRPDDTQDHHRRQEETGGPGVAEQTRVDRFHVKHPLPVR